MFYDSITKLETVTNIRVVPESQRYCDDVHKYIGVAAARRLAAAKSLINRW